MAELDASRLNRVSAVASLLIIDIEYVVELSEVDRHIDGHMAFISENYDAGRFLLSGRKEPRTGGVIIARGDRAEIEALIESDPFKQHGVAEYSVTEFIPTTTALELAFLKHTN
jgi:uncharacterized protein YciI